MASMARVPNWAVALALIAACFVPTTLAWGWGYSYSGCSGYPFYSECSGWTCDGKACLGNCPYGGYATATCVGGDWKINVTCNSAPKTCNYMPPYCEGVSWPSDSPGKNKVYAYCGAGYCGVVSATCVDGTWVLSGTCQKVQKPPTCSGTPPACEGTSWTCDGYKCHGYCGDGYCGVVTANCWYGQWVVEGYCKKVTYVPPPTCTGTPSPCEGASWSCSSDKCIGFCGNGYAGSINAYCWNGQWVVSGSCQKVTIVPPKPNTCSGMPPSCSGIAWSPRCDGKSYCGANCMAGYYEGYVSSTCVNGAWTTPVGYCTPVVNVTPKCKGKPKKGKYCLSWKCSHGKTCKAKCAWGCSGGYKAKCVNGKWKVSGSCKLVSLWNYNSEWHISAGSGSLLTAAF